jgi:mono/diheme cytochrome c family protein
MKLKLALSALAVVLLSAPALAGPRDDILQGYAAAAKTADPAFAGFDAARGKALYEQQNTASAEAPSCASCHSASPLKAGKTRAGKAIDPMAVSVTPDRFTDAAKVEKWFGRNCNTVLGRDCTAAEKGDFITYLSGI